MRAVLLFLLGLLCVCGVSAQTQTFHVTGNTGITNYTIDGQQDPTLTLTAGNTYAFSLELTASTSHPFAFSGDGSTDAVSITTIDSSIAISSTDCDGSVTAGYTKTNCKVTVALTAAAAGKTFYYRCAFHKDMVGTINVVAATVASSTGSSTGDSSSTGGDSSSPSSTGASNNSSSTAGASSSPSSTGASSTDSSTGASSTDSSTGASPSSSSSSSSVAPAGPITGATLTGSSFRITGTQNVNGTFISYIFTANGVEYANPSLNVYAGVVVTFSLEYAASTHPFGFSPSGNSSVVAIDTATFPDEYNAESTLNCSQPNAAVKVFTPATTGTPCVLTEVIPAAFVGQSSYYRCAVHKLMLGKITVVAAPSSSSSSTGGATSAPTGTGTSSTPAPTTTPPTTPPGSKSSSSSTGTTGSAAKVPGTGLAFIAAIMAAIMA